MMALDNEAVQSPKLIWSSNKIVREIKNKTQSYWQNFLPFLIHLFNKYFLNAYYFPGYSLSTGDLAMNKTEFPSAWGLYSLRGDK